MPAANENQDEAARADRAARWKETKDRNRETRLALLDRLRTEGAADLTTRLEKCGKSVGLVCVCCGETKTAETRCKARWCPECAPIVAMERREKWGHALKAVQWPLFVTLTMENSTDPEALRACRKAWGKFRRRKFFKSTVTGGVGTFEITNRGNGWHPHIHAILDCRWFSLNVREPHWRDSAEIRDEKCRLAQRELSAVWADVLGQPTSTVWVNRVASHEVVEYVLKYAAKGSDLLECQDEIAPMIRVLSKTRTLSGFGKLHPLPSPDEDEGPVSICPACQAESPWMPDFLVAGAIKSDEPQDHRAAIPVRSFLDPGAY